MSDVTLLIGLGATKAGTSWLYRYFVAHPEVHARAPKELHFWDTLEHGRLGWQRQALSMDIERDVSKAKAGSVGAMMRVADMRHWETILDAPSLARYVDFLREGQGAAPVVIGERLRMVAGYANEYLRMHCPVGAICRCDRAAVIACR